MDENDILDLIKKLGSNRRIPQFLFANQIHPSTMIKVREEVLKFKKEFPDTKEIDFIIQSPGGSPSDAYRIIRTLRNNFESVNVIVPFWAKSAATLLSLGATQIIMDEYGEFGPLDIQIAIERDDSPELDRESALNDEYSVRRIEARSQELYYQMFTALYSSDNVKINKNELSKQLLEYLSSFYRPLLSQINPYHLGRKKRMLDIGDQYANRILSIYCPSLSEKNKNFLIDYLVNRCPEHGYVIDFNFISMFMDNVSLSKDINIEYGELLSEVTTFFIDNEDYTHIGFVLIEKKKLTKGEHTLTNTSSNLDATNLTTAPKEIKSKIKQNGKATSNKL